jgi:hypothetical protein
MKQVDKHAHGPLTTKGRRYEKPDKKAARDRIRRWAKRVLRALAKKETFGDE